MEPKRDGQEVAEMAEAIQRARRDDRACPVCERLKEHCSCKEALEWVAGELEG